MLLLRIHAWLTDARLMFVLGVLSVLVGMAVLLDTDDLGRYSYGMADSWCGPSVMVAAGKGFVEPLYPPDSPMGRFLSQECPSITREEALQGVESGTLSGFSEMYFYMLYAIGLTWRLFGISWGTLSLLIVVFFCATSLVVFGVFRLVMNRYFSFVGTLCFMCSPLTLGEFPVFRDFVKAPFILGVTLLFIYLLKRPRAPKAYCAAAALMGLVTGVGVGFRFDVSLCVFPSVFVLAFCRLGSPGRNLRLRVGAIAMLLVVFRLAAWYPINADAPRGSQYHIIGGYGETCEKDMHLTRASYVRHAANDDFLNDAVVNHYGAHVMHVDKYLPYISPQAVAPGQKYIRDVMKTFPADMLMRGYGALLSILKDTAVNYPSPPINFILGVNRLTAPLAAHLKAFAPYYLIAALLMVAVRDLRYAWMALLLVLFFGAYPNLQFHPRHYFHLTFFSLWFFGFVLEHLGCSLRRAWRMRGRFLTKGTGRLPWRIPELRRVFVFAATAGAAILLPIFPARAYQTHVLGKMLDELATTDLEPIETAPEPYDAGYGPETLFTVVHPTDFSAQGDNPRLSTEYLVAVFTPCDEPCSVRILYEVDPWYTGFRRDRSIAPPKHPAPGNTMFFFPVHEYPQALSTARGGNRFKGLAITSHLAGHFIGLYRVKDIEKFPLILEMTVFPDRRDFTFYQTLDFSPPQ